MSSSERRRVFRVFFCSLLLPICIAVLYILRQDNSITAGEPPKLDRVYCIQKEGLWIEPKFGRDYGFDEKCDHYAYATSEEKLKSYYYGRKGAQTNH